MVNIYIMFNEQYLFIRGFFIFLLKILDLTGSLHTPDTPDSFLEKYSFLTSSVYNYIT